MWNEELRLLRTAHSSLRTSIMLRLPTLSPKGAQKAKPDRATARRQFLALKPVRNPNIEQSETEGRVLLTITPPDTRLSKVLSLFLPLSPEERKKRVVLDPLGSHVWRLCDGQTTMEAISKSLQKTFKLGTLESEQSLRQFFQTLGKRGYVGFVQNSGRGDTQKRSAGE